MLAPLTEVGGIKSVGDIPTSPHDPIGSDSIQVIIRLGGIPNPGLFDEGSADMNYLSIVFLFERLLRLKAEAIRELEERVGQTNGYPEAREVLLGILNEDRRRHEHLVERFDLCRLS